MPASVSMQATQRFEACVDMQMDSLMGHFQQQSGQQFTGHSSQYDMIAKMASEKLGIPVPASIIEKL